jgi:hypothetical protein
LNFSVLNANSSAHAPDHPPDESLLFDPLRFRFLRQRRIPAVENNLFMP